MATLISIADEMAKKFVTAKDKKYALNMIVYDLNYLVYSHNKEPLSYKAKSIIFNHIFDVVAGRQTLPSTEGDNVTPHFSDIVLFFERRSSILNYLKTGRKQQEQMN